MCNQLLKGKTNHPVSFLVHAITCRKKQVTVIKIAKVQHRPLFPARIWGSLRAMVVYVRRGSSTVELTPDELIDMGRKEILDDEQR